ncbi:MAG: gliding motility protein GldN [Bacteroidetes bacterium]|nr:MAG: gliding motility protein GldN [Bacteroidota bacterium]
MRKIILITGFIITIVASGFGQTILDGAYVKENIRTKKVVPYPALREADVLWSKEVWRIIDLREKINFPLYYPIEPIKDRLSLFDVIRQAILVDGSLTAYNPGPTKQDDEFNFPYSQTELRQIFTQVDTVTAEDPDTGEFVEVVQETELSSAEITQYRLKEYWVFDKQTSTMQVRIIGIAPMKELYSEEGMFLGHQPIFWIYYPEARYVFVNYEVFNPSNDAQRLSFDDVFTKRIFNSYIDKEANAYDRKIMEYAQGLDALLEAERIKEEIFTWEHDLWSY